MLKINYKTKLIKISSKKKIFSKKYYRWTHRRYNRAFLNHTRKAIKIAQKKNSHFCVIITPEIQKWRRIKKKFRIMMSQIRKINRKIMTRNANLFKLDMLITCKALLWYSFKSLIFHARTLFCLKEKEKWKKELLIRSSWNRLDVLYFLKGVKLCLITFNSLWEFYRVVLDKYRFIWWSGDWYRRS